MANINADMSTGPAFKPMAGQVGCLVSTVEVATKQSLNDTVTFGTLPKGAKVLGGTLYAGDVEAGSTYELDIGISGNSDKYLDSGAIAAAATPLLGELLTAGPVELTAEETIIGTVAAEATGAGLGTITLVVQYTSA
jgi:hypothetical protein